MDFYYIGSDICRFQSKKPCWLVRQFQRLFLDLHWVCTPDPESVDLEELKRAAEEEYTRNYCEKYGVNVDEYPSLREAYLEATKIKIDRTGHKVKVF